MPAGPPWSSAASSTWPPPTRPSATSGRLSTSCGGPVVVSLAGVRFCDARGLYALVRMAHYAQRADCPFRVTSPSPRLTRLMQITGLGETFLAAS